MYGSDGRIVILRRRGRGDQGASVPVAPLKLRRCGRRRCWRGSESDAPACQSRRQTPLRARNVNPGGRVFAEQLVVGGLPPQQSLKLPLVASQLR
jgi:hypothetical protein